VPGLCSCPSLLLAKPKRKSEANSLRSASSQPGWEEQSKDRQWPKGSACAVDRDFPGAQRPKDCFGASWHYIGDGYCSCHLTVGQAR
jgi:hypothetical protein